MFFPLDPARWYPAQRTGFCVSKSLTPGQIVIWERAAYRVLETRERDQSTWPDSFRDKWVEWGMPDPATWSGRPFVIVLRIEQDPDAKPLHLLGPADHDWKTLPEHYSVCRVCLELPPCTHVHNEAVMTAAGKTFAEEMAIIPGVCHGCREPVSQRQKSIRFEGENLIRPDLGDGTAIFHLKQSCRWAAKQYDEKWAKAVPGRRRKLFCEGRARHHYDGTFDCTEGALCPGKVNHCSSEWHRPGQGLTAGCWCVSGDLTARIEAQMRDGEVSQ